jgi:hypothetical protein
MSRCVLTIALIAGLCCPALADTTSRVVLDPNVSTLGRLEVHAVDCAVHCSTLMRNLERTYRSPLNGGLREGWFGIGWVSPLEAHLAYRPDGSIEADDGGAGGTLTFVPTDPSLKSSREHAIAAVMYAAQETGLFGSESERSAYLRQLEGSTSGPWTDFLVEEWSTFLNRGLIRAPDIPVGAVFVDEGQGETLTRLRDRYERTSSHVQEGQYPFRAYGEFRTYNGSFEARLVRLWDAHDGFEAIDYDGDKATAVWDSSGDRLDLTFNDQTLLSSVRSVAKNRSARYVYSKLAQRSDLLKATDFDGKVSSYHYDVDHLMDQITFPDGTKNIIGYNISDRVLTLQSGGITTGYLHAADTLDQRHAEVYDMMRIGGKDQKLWPVLSYIFVDDASGAYVERVLEIGAASVTETRYDPFESLVAPRATLPRQSFVFYSQADGSIDQINAGGHLLRLYYNADGTLIATRVDETYLSLSYDSGKLHAIGIGFSTPQSLTASYDATGGVVLAGSPAIAAQVKDIVARASEMLGPLAQKYPVLGLIRSAKGP